MLRIFGPRKYKSICFFNKPYTVKYGYINLLGVEMFVLFTFHIYTAFN